MRTDEEIRNAIQDYEHAKGHVTSLRNQMDEAERRVSETAQELIRVMKHSCPGKDVILGPRRYHLVDDGIVTQPNNDVVLG